LHLALLGCEFQDFVSIVFSTNVRLVIFLYVVDEKVVLLRTVLVVLNIEFIQDDLQFPGCRLKVPFTLLFLRIVTGIVCGLQVVC